MIACAHRRVYDPKKSKYYLQMDASSKKNCITNTYFLIRFILAITLFLKARIEALCRSIFPFSLFINHLGKLMILFTVKKK
jgi:hypothetical protein